MRSPAPLQLSVAWRLRAAAAAVVIPPLVSVASFTQLAARLGRPRGRVGPGHGPDDASLARWVDGLLRRLPAPWRRTCLKRTAVLYHLLRRAGRPVEMWIGVRRDAAGTLVAHAWLMRDGAPYLESGSDPASRHAVIARFPESRASSG
jgi:hypothetical protein